MKIETNLDEYHCPKYTFDLLGVWGRSLYLGMPYLGSGKKSAVLGDHTGDKYPVEPPTYDPEEIDRITAAVGSLTRRQIESLKCRFRYRVSIDEFKSRAMNKREAAKHLGITVDQYLEDQRGAMREIDVIINGEVAA